MKPARTLAGWVACGRLVARTTLICAALSLTACPQGVQRPENGPTEPAAVVARLAERGRALTSLSGLLALEVWRKDERVRLRQLLLVARPDRVRVDTLSPFDAPLAMMATDGKTLTIYSLENKRYEQGPATPAHLARLLRLPLTGEELTSVLSGGVPLPENARSSLDWDAEAGAYVLDLVAGARRQRIHLEPEALRMVALRTYEGETLVFLGRFGDYDGTGPTAVPRRMHFEVPAEGLRVDARFEDHSVNVVPPEDAFTIPPPRGIPVEPLQ